ncbi:MAG: CoA transferase [Alphaproteobacteria bacterium]|nr:CoA transferase [Alphaproteobacteria bacterium]
MATGPLSGVKIVEFAGIGPGPFCAMLLSDMGADIIRIDRKGAKGSGKNDITNRGRRSIALDLKKPEAVEACLQLIEKADVLQEGFRPGVMERLGLSPEVCLARNPKLVYGRMTGWGQTGTFSQAAGHDINYIALSSALASIGTKTRPIAPLNLVGDFGGGALYLAMGICAALFEAQRSGKGQVIDCAMTDGAASLMSMFFGMKAAGIWDTANRATNLLDGGAHFYDAFETADGKFIALGSIEPQFYALLREKAGLDDKAFDAQMDKSQWADLKEKVASVIKQKTRDEWDNLMTGTDVCYAPVLDMDEAPHHPHNKARQTFVEAYGVMQPNVAPRFDRTESAIQSPPPKIGEHNATAFADWGVDANTIATLKKAEGI